jgi:hypothetical protein
MRTAQGAMRMPLPETGKASLSERSGKLTAGPRREKKKGKRKRMSLCKDYAKRMRQCFAGWSQIATLQEVMGSKVDAAIRLFLPVEFLKNGGFHFGKLNEDESEILVEHLIECDRCSRVLEERIILKEIIHRNSNEIFEGLVTEEMIESKNSTFSHLLEYMKRLNRPGVRWRIAFATGG